MPSYKTKAIVLKSYNLGEADKILKLFSNENGLVDAVAKGARKIKSRFGGRLEIFNFLELELSKGRSLDIINQAELIKNFSHIPEDFNSFLFSQYICEIVLKTHFSRTDITPLIFKLLYACLNELNCAKGEDLLKLQKITAFFIAKFLKITGYPPLIYSCCVCGNEIKSGFGSFSFSIRLGGIICADCEAGIQNSPDLKKKITLETVSFLGFIFNAGLKDYMEAAIDESILNVVFKILEEYLKYHYDLNINSGTYLKSISG